MKKYLPTYAAMTAVAILVLINFEKTLGETLLSSLEFIFFAFSKYFQFEWLELTLGQVMFVIILITLLTNLLVSAFKTTTDKHFYELERILEWEKENTQKTLEEIRESFDNKDGSGYRINLLQNRRQILFVTIILFFSTLFLYPFLGLIEAIFELPNLSEWGTLIHFYLLLFLLPIVIYLIHKDGEDQKEFVGTSSYYDVKPINDKIRKNKESESR
tara:strand:+ start:40 stop:687 length:648 start_codon:yes stop_codon:yes gene_type:complete